MAGIKSPVGAIIKGRTPLDPTRSPANPGIPVRSPANPTPMTPVRGAPIIKPAPVKAPVQRNPVKAPAIKDLAPKVKMPARVPSLPARSSVGGASKQRRDKIGRWV